MEPTEYVCEFPNDKSAIDINRVTDFYNSIYADSTVRENMHINIHNYAKKMADMQVVMKPIIEYVSDN